MVEPSSLEARRLHAKYREISALGHFDFVLLSELGQTCERLSGGLSPARELVVRTIARTVHAIQAEWGELAGGGTTWPHLDNALLRATAFVSRSEDADDAIDISLSLDDATCAWLGR